VSRATRERDAIIANLERGQIRKTRSTDQSKRQQRDQAYFAKGVELGAHLMQMRIQNSTAGLTYDDSPTVEGASVGEVGLPDSGDIDHTDRRSSFVGDPDTDPLAASESDSLPA
jgi:hypothetical protein